MKKILIVDDDDLVRMACTNILKKENFEVLEAGDGNRGLDLFKKEKPVLVITDILMPEKEGLETIVEIKAIAPDIKIIAISGGGSTQNMSFLRYAERLGADATLTKPIRPSPLLSAVHRLLKD